MGPTNQQQQQSAGGQQHDAQQSPQQQDQSPNAQDAIRRAAAVVLGRLGIGGPAKPAGGQQQAGQQQDPTKDPNLLGKITSTLATLQDHALDDARRLVGDAGHLAQKIKDVAIDVGGQAVGVAELAGLRYPVTTYEKQVSSALFRGSRVTAEQMGGLQQQGIKGIVNLCLENNDDAGPAKQLGINALHIPILDNSSPTIGQMQQFVAFVQDGGNDPVYVHCEAGKGRTGTAVACYRIAAEGWSAEQAIAEYKSMGGALPNQMAFIARFAATVSGEAPKNAEADPKAQPPRPGQNPA